MDQFSSEPAALSSAIRPAPVLEVLPVEPILGRLPSLDLIRGVAILGILLANICWFLGPTPDLGQKPPPESASDQVVILLTLVFIDGKFITMLSILFGAGLAVQSERADAGGRPFVGYYLRRQGLLFGIGLAHALFLWYGDILASYAIVGAGALALRRLGQRWLVWVIVGLLAGVYLIGILFILVTLAFSGLEAEVGPEQYAALLPADPDEPLSLSPRAVASEVEFKAYLSPENQVRTYRHGSFMQMVALRLVFLAFYVFGFWIWVGWDILACFLIGIYLWRRGLFLPGERAARLAKLLIWIGLGVSLPFMVGLFIWRLLDPENLAAELLVMLTALPQALGYLGLLLLWVQSGWAAWLQDRLRAVGRLALTNYLMQSFLCGLIFYGYGLGLFGTLDRLAGLGVVLAIWALQLALSPLWLHYFRIGPVEWLWRSLADGRLQQFRQDACAWQPSIPGT